MSEPRRLLHSFLVGAALGGAAADLVLGLNPQAIPSWGAWVLVLCGAGGAAGALAAAVRPPRGPEPSRAGWLLLAVLLGLTACLAESQRLLYYFFVANATRRVLVAATLVSSAGAAGAVLAALLRPSRRTSTGLLSALVLLFALAPLAALRPPGPPELSSPAPTARAAKRSLVIVGLEGISWNLLVQGAADGRLPALRRLLDEGAAGPVEALVPYDRDAAWTTVATGKRPSRHGIVSSRRYDGPFGSLRLVPRPFGLGAPTNLPLFRTVETGGRDRRSLAFWEILSARGHEASVLNWPAAPPRPGLVLWAPPGFFGAAGSTEVALPSAAAARAALFRVDPARLERTLSVSLAPPELSPADRRKARAEEGAAADLSVVGAALAALPRGEGSAVTLVLSGLGPVARLYGPSAEPSRFWGRSPKDPDTRTQALFAYYRFLDELLGELLQGEGEERTVCVFSPASWGPPYTVPAVARFLSGQEPAAEPNASPGFVILAGSGLRRQVRLTSVTVYDLMPTLLALAGEPIARDLDGRVLAEAFDERFSQSTSVPIITTFEPRGPQ